VVGIVRFVLHADDPLLESEYSIVAKVQTEAIPGTLNRNIVHTAEVYMRGNFSRVNVWVKKGSKAVVSGFKSLKYGREKQTVEC
jgi:hypothetical protein